MENLILFTIILCGTVLDEELAGLVKNNNFFENKILGKLNHNNKIALLKKLLNSLNGNLKMKKNDKETITISIIIPSVQPDLNFENWAIDMEMKKVRLVPNRKGAFIHSVRKIIETKMKDESFGIQRLCMEIGLSRSQLHNKIKLETGLSTSIYIRSVRLEKAKFLLLQTELNISEVAYAVGFKDPSYFSRLFSEKYKISPSNFKKYR